MRIQDSAIMRIVFTIQYASIRPTENEIEPNLSDLLFTIFDGQIRYLHQKPISQQEVVSMELFVLYPIITAR